MAIELPSDMRNKIMKFKKEFNTLKYIIKNSQRILLFAHSRPDNDTIGSTMAFYYYLFDLGKSVEVTCFDPMPEYLKVFAPYELRHPDKIDLESFDSVIAMDSVERGFEKVREKFSKKQVVALIDHHPDVKENGDLNIIDPAISSVSEIIFDYFDFHQIKIGSRIATLLLAGILGDTGNLQHANTTPKVMHSVAKLLNRGASVSKISKMIFSNNRFSTLKLWGRALEKAKINSENKMIATVITKKDLDECEASYEDTAEIASILNTVPETSFSLVLSERDGGVIKGSLRSEKYKGVDVSEVAHQFGGGGHKLASGFEIKGKIVEEDNGWKII
ncbi:MAG: bifunctional oligoribonuclease/PAP phosphatase NrnA [Sphingobacteriia bacterium]|nr:bifunctional oligoribonuclease/PAP phosphatase NrnA [Sphingobacteriia bacterium]